MTNFSESFEFWRDIKTVLSGVASLTKECTSVKAKPMTPGDSSFSKYTQDTQNKLTPCRCTRDYKNRKCANLASESCYLSNFFTRVTEWDDPTEGHSNPMVCMKEKTTIAASIYQSPTISGVHVKLRETVINVGIRKMTVCEKLSEEEQSKCCNEKYVCNVWRTTAAYMDPVLFPAISDVPARGVVKNIQLLFAFQTLLVTALQVVTAALRQRPPAETE